jgi:hypothetical protein
MMVSWQLSKSDRFRTYISLDTYPLSFSCCLYPLYCNFYCLYALELGNPGGLKDGFEGDDGKSKSDRLWNPDVSV